MKKHLLAVAVASAIAAPAMAQNVSVYGYLETGLENTKTSGTASTSSATNLTTGMFGSSRLGFKGSEDLGGGLKAGFRLEMSANATNGAGGGGTNMSTVSTGVLFNRGAEVNLSGAFGTIAMGKLDHPGIEGNEVNKVGNIALFETETEGTSGSAPAASDTNNTILYTAPLKMIGGQLTVGYTGKSDGAVNPNGTHEGIRSYQFSGEMAGVTYKLGSGSIKTSSGSYKFVGGGVGYNFGPLNVGLQIQKQDVPASAEDISETVITAKYDLGGGLDVRAAYATYDVGTTTANDQNKLTLAVAKALSKRTTAYVAYRSVDVNTSTNNDTRELGVYIGHSF